MIKSPQNSDLKALEFGGEFSAFLENMRKFFHDYRQPLSTLKLLGSDILEAYRYHEIDEKYLNEYARVLIKQVNHLDSLVEGLSEKIQKNSQIQIQNHWQLFSVCTILESLKSFFESFEIGVQIQEDVLILGEVGEEYRMRTLFLLCLQGIESYMQNKNHQGVITLDSGRFSFRIAHFSREEFFANPKVESFVWFMRSYHRHFKNSKKDVDIEVVEELSSHFELRFLPH